MKGIVGLWCRTEDDLAEVEGKHEVEVVGPTGIFLELRRWMVGGESWRVREKQAKHECAPALPEHDRVMRKKENV